jgi:glucose-6-phosphate dehydrogenase-like protein
MAEDIGIGGQASYYDGIGAARDVIQDHVLRLLALTATSLARLAGGPHSRGQFRLFASPVEGDGELRVMVRSRVSHSLAAFSSPSSRYWVATPS